MEATLARFREWVAQEQDLRYAVSVDVGGTNTRVAFRSPQFPGETLHFKVPVHQVSELIRLLTDASAQIVQAAGGRTASGAAMAIAGPVLGDKAVITNYAGSTEERTINASDLPAGLFPAGRTRFLNDLEACCYGILELNETNQISEYFDLMFGPAHSAKLEARPYPVLAMGTGLGVGLLVPLRTGGFQVLPLEASHCLISPTGLFKDGSVADRDLLDALSFKLYGGQYPLEFEDICSGRGLEAVYAQLSQKQLSSGEIAGLCDSGDDVARQAMYYHYKYLMAAAQNMCVASVARGCFFAGDNQVRNNGFVTSVAETLHKDFVNHPRGSSWLVDMSAFKQTKELNLNLLGSFYVVERS